MGQPLIYDIEMYRDYTFRVTWTLKIDNHALQNVYRLARPYINKGVPLPEKVGDTCVVSGDIPLDPRFLKIMKTATLGNMKTLSRQVREDGFILLKYDIVRASFRENKKNETYTIIEYAGTYKKL